MDKYEYKIKAAEIEKLAANKEYTKALAIVDTIDWRRVKSVVMLSIVSEIYKINRRYEDSKAILLLAYERNQNSKFTIYSLCEICTKLGQIVEAVDYFNRFVHLAPNDLNRYILRYRIYEAQEVSVEERIEVLEEFMQVETNLSEKWCYELAYLYHRAGQSARCVEECDSLILLYGTGRYVMKAMDLKMLHEPLTESQQAKYERNLNRSKKRSKPAVEEVAPVEEIPEEVEIEVKTVDVGEYNTTNLQQELAASMQEFMFEQAVQEEPEVQEEIFVQEEVLVYEEEQTYVAQEEVLYEEQVYVEQEEVVFEEQIEPTYEEQVALAHDEVIEAVVAPLLQDTVEISREELAAIHAQEVYLQDQIIDESEPLEPNTLGKIVIREEGEAVTSADFAEEIIEVEDFLHTQELGDVEELAQLEELLAEANIDETAQTPVDESKDELEVILDALLEEESEKREEEEVEEIASHAASNIKVHGNLANQAYASILVQEYDGQIGLAVSENEQLERQITGQLSISDILLEWEQMKKENEEKRSEENRQRVLQQTSDMFSEYDEATKADILEELNHLAEVDEYEEEMKRYEQYQPEAPVQEEVVIDDSYEEEAQEEVVIADSYEEEIPEEVVIDDSYEEEVQEEVVIDDSYEEEAQEEVVIDDSYEEEIQEEVVIDDSYEEEIQEEAQDTTENQEVIQVVELETPVETGEVEVVGIEEVPEPEVVEQVEDTVEEVLMKADKTTVVPEFNAEQKKLFSKFIKMPKCREQILATIDGMMLASHSGNVIITGESVDQNFELATSLIREVKTANKEFSGRVARITAQKLNTKEVGAVFRKLKDGALIIENADKLNTQTISGLLECMGMEDGIIIFLQGVKHDIEKLLKRRKDLLPHFNLRIDVDEENNDSLVKYAIKYAYDREYAIDEVGSLALHTRIAQMQTSSHRVTMKEVEEIVQVAMARANRKTFAHFMDVILGKRYDEEDMIVLQENDFIIQ